MLTSDTRDEAIGLGVGGLIRLIRDCGLGGVPAPMLILMAKCLALRCRTIPWAVLLLPFASNAAEAQGLLAAPALERC